MSQFPRRNCHESLTPAELAICEAMQAVETLPPDTRLTDAIVLLQRARERTADYVDGVAGVREEAAPQTLLPTPPPTSPAAAAHADVEHIAAMFQLLHAAGMSEALAIEVIRERMTAHERELNISSLHDLLPTIAKTSGGWRP